MKSMLESGTTLVVDRYAYSGIAFTGAKQVKRKRNLVTVATVTSLDNSQKLINSDCENLFCSASLPFSQKFSLDWCRQSDRGLPKPDLVIYLDLPPHVAKTRADYGDERYEKEEFQRKVAECYEKLREDDWKVSYTLSR